MNKTSTIKECAYCGNEFVRPKWQADKMLFCSRSCLDNSKRKIICCKVCNKEVNVIKSSKQIYCSLGCRNTDICTGKKLSDAHRGKLKISGRGKKSGPNNPAWGKFGKDSWTYGTKRTEEVKSKLSEMRMGKRSGIESATWKGGISKEKYGSGWTPRRKKQIRERDNNLCQLCGEHGNDVHHIDYDKNNMNEDNLITLCRKHHMKTNYNRPEWTIYFAWFMYKRYELNKVA